MLESILASQLLTTDAVNVFPINQSMTPGFQVADSRVMFKDLVYSAGTECYGSVAPHTHNPRQATSHNHQRQDNPSTRVYIHHISPIFLLFLSFLSSPDQKSKKTIVTSTVRKKISPNYEIDAKVKNLSLRD